MRSSKSRSLAFMRFLASSIIVSESPSFDEIAKALLLPGMPIKSLYVGLNVSTLNSQDAFSTPSVERA